MRFCVLICFFLSESVYADDSIQIGGQFTKVDVNFFIIRLSTFEDKWIVVYFFLLFIRSQV